MQGYNFKVIVSAKNGNTYAALFDDGYFFVIHFNAIVLQRKIEDIENAKTAFLAECKERGLTIE